MVHHRNPFIASPVILRRYILWFGTRVHQFLDITPYQGKEHDFAVTAFRVVQEATGQIERPKPQPRHFNAKALGHLGGLKGGRARAERLTPERRVEIAKKAAMARWGKSA